MQSENISEEKVLYDGLIILARIIARAITEESHKKETMLKAKSPPSNQEPMNDTANSKPERLVFSVCEAAKLIGLSRPAAYKAVRAGSIPSIRFGRRIVIPRAALLNFLDEAGDMK